MARRSFLTSALYPWFFTRPLVRARGAKHAVAVEDSGRLKEGILAKSRKEPAKAEDDLVVAAAKAIS